MRKITKDDIRIYNTYKYGKRLTTVNWTYDALGEVEGKSRTTIMNIVKAVEESEHKLETTKAG
jgi:hypothetical protein